MKKLFFIGLMLLSGLANAGSYKGVFTTDSLANCKIVKEQPISKTYSVEATFMNEVVDALNGGYKGFSSTAKYDGATAIVGYRLSQSMTVARGVIKGLFTLDGVEVWCK